MKLADLQFMTSIFIANRINASSITIKGKASISISFTAPRAQYSAIAEMCEAWNWRFTTSADTFINRHLDRYQVYLSRAVPPKRTRRTDAQMRADGYKTLKELKRDES